jgi:hypothetical protein
MDQRHYQKEDSAMKRIKFTETGYDARLGVIVVTAENAIFKIESCLMREGCYLKLTNSQAKRLAFFIKENLKEEKHEKKR